MKSMLKRVGALTLVGIAFAACSDGDVTTPAGPEAVNTTFNSTHTSAFFNVCKVYVEAGAEGDYEFQWEIAPTGGGGATGSSFDLTAGDGTKGRGIGGCADEGATTDSPIEVPVGSTLTVTEVAVAIDGTASLDPGLPVSLTPYLAPNGECFVNETNAQALGGIVTVDVTATECGAFSTYLLAFKNISFDEPGGSEGCTPGYWKQEHHFDSWVGYLPTDDFDSTFSVDWFSPNITLLDALELKGGKINALARHAVAALLSAGSVDYPQSVADVIADVQAVDDTDKNAVEALKNRLDEQNNLGCPLN
jgi:hypothetical protein